MQKRIRVNAYGRELQLRLERSPIERFDIDELVRKLVVARIELVVGQGVEHERIVGIGAVPDPNQLLSGGQDKGLLMQ